MTKFSMNKETKKKDSEIKKTTKQKNEFEFNFKKIIRSQTAKNHFFRKK